MSAAAGGARGRFIPIVHATAEGPIPYVLTARGRAALAAYTAPRLSLEQLRQICSRCGFERGDHDAHPPHARRDDRLRPGAGGLCAAFVRDEDLVDGGAR